ncbi:MAG: hypothetical protein H6Q39_373 [Chloroflexi bacterium]|nr:hypothetical protein [Chloroflexota bacterium]
MAGAPKLRIKKFFGSSTIEEMVLNLDEARGYLNYFWQPDQAKHTVPKTATRIGLLLR